MKESEVKRILSQTDWWHGTTLSAWKNIQKNGMATLPVGRKCLEIPRFATLYQA